MTSSTTKPWAPRSSPATWRAPRSTSWPEPPRREEPALAFPRTILNPRCVVLGRGIQAHCSLPARDLARALNGGEPVYAPRAAGTGPMTSDVLVVGGNVVGCAIASACAKRGLGVTLVERGRIAGAASSSISPSWASRRRPGSGRWRRPAKRPTSSSTTSQAGHSSSTAARSSATTAGRTPVRRIDVPGAALALAEEARSHRAGCKRDAT